MVDLQQEFRILAGLSTDAAAADKKRRGFAFEKFLKRCFDTFYNGIVQAAQQLEDA